MRRAQNTESLLALQDGEVHEIRSRQHLQLNLIADLSFLDRERTLTESLALDDDDDVLIELPGLPNRGMLCGYKNGSSAAVASLSGIIYLMYNWLCSEVTSGSSAPVSPKLKNESATCLF